MTDRFFRAKGVAPEALSPLDRLAYIGNQGVGALEYRPIDPDAAGPGGGMDLAEVAEQAERIVAGSPEEALPALRAAGGSSGGSKPKVFIAFNPASGQISPDLVRTGPGFEHWLVKFRAKEDPEDAGCIEAAYAEMARAAGIVMSPTRLFTTKAGRFFGIQRFDRGPLGARFTSPPLEECSIPIFSIPIGTIRNFSRSFLASRENTRRLSRPFAGRFSTCFDALTMIPATIT